MDNFFYPQSFAQVMLSNMTGTCTGFARCALNNARAGVVRKRSSACSACKSVSRNSLGGGKQRHRDGNRAVRWDRKPPVTPGGGKSTRRWDGKPAVVKSELEWDVVPVSQKHRVGRLTRAELLTSQTRERSQIFEFSENASFSGLQWDVVPVSQKHRVGRLTRAEHMTSQSRERSQIFKFVENARNGGISSGEGNRRPYRWWKARACIEENNKWEKRLETFETRIIACIEDERSQKRKDYNKGEKKCHVFCEDELADLKKQRTFRRLVLVQRKEEVEREWMRSQRARVKQIRADMDRQDALKCFGCCPGERTLTNDWSFWNGFDCSENVFAYKKHGKKNEAMHGRGCGGSSEWLATLKRQRSAMNRKIAEQQRFKEQSKQRKSECKRTEECSSV